MFREICKSHKISYLIFQIPPKKRGWALIPGISSTSNPVPPGSRGSSIGETSHQNVCLVLGNRSNQRCLSNRHPAPVLFHPRMRKLKMVIAQNASKSCQRMNLARPRNWNCQLNSLKMAMWREWNHTELLTWRKHLRCRINQWRNRSRSLKRICSVIASILIKKVDKMSQFKSRSQKKNRQRVNNKNKKIWLIHCLTKTRLIRMK